MKSILTIKRILILAGLLSASTATAQVTLPGGSDGSDGALVVTNSMSLTMPPDGIFNYTTINIAAGATLEFSPNDLNTPVYLLATGDILIEGIISVDGKDGDSVAGLGGAGGPGGYAGGGGGTISGDGHGPEGGAANTGDIANESGGSSYLTPLLVPLLGGSGGAGRVSAGGAGLGGGGGAGAIVIGSNTQINLGCAGQITAIGGARPAGTAGAGADGAVRLVAPIIREIAPPGGGFCGARIEAGRVRFDAIDTA